MKKIFQMALMAAAIMSVLASCNSTGELENRADTQAVLQEKTVFTAWAILWPQYTTHMDSNNEIAGYIELEKRTNVHIDWKHATYSGARESYNLLIASKDFPDFIESFVIYHTEGVDKAIEDGIIIRHNEVVEEHIPNYSNLLNTFGLNKDAITDSGAMGNLYCIFSEPQDAAFGFMVRHDWLSDLALAVPTTYDDWHTMLTQFKDSKGALAPMMLPRDNVNDSEWSNFKSGFGVANSFYNVDGKVKYGPVEPGFRDWLEMVSTWYAEGLIDKDFMTRETNIVNPDPTYIYTGKAGAWIGATRAQYTGSSAYRFGLTDDPAYYCMSVQNPVLNMGDISHLRAPSEQLDGGCAITTACKDVETLAKWFNYCYGDEGSLYLNYGIEGETFFFDDSGEPCLKAEWINERYDNENYSITRFLTGPLSTSYVRQAVRNSDPPIRTEEHAEATATVMRDLNDWAMPSFLSPKPEEITELSSIMSDVDTFVSETVIKVILGVETLDDYDKAVEQIFSMDIRRAISLKQAALDRYIGRGE